MKKPEISLLQGKPYTPSYSTDIRKTFAKFCPEWQKKMCNEFAALPIAKVEVHHMPRSLYE